MKADLFEAIIGAIAIDSGWDIKRLKNIIIKMLDIEHFFRDVDCREKRPNKCYQYIKRISRAWWMLNANISNIRKTYNWW